MLVHKLPQPTDVNVSVAKNGNLLLQFDNDIPDQMKQASISWGAKKGANGIDATRELIKSQSWERKYLGKDAVKK